MDALAHWPASMFRDGQASATSEILELAGCDLLTSRAELMKQVSGSHESVAFRNDFEAVFARVFSLRTQPIVLQRLFLEGP
jgi:hypothetical protein